MGMHGQLPSLTIYGTAKYRMRALGLRFPMACLALLGHTVNFIFPRRQYAEIGID